ncbi:hypothetical protein BZG36_00462 [Bifiguratus adelaidae]|uniref:Riboflavin synthase n=1 Tax=Bifiguratus adelaidae TaxID=1938954 RepID=A0A261Y758_9FUNG|nr:hypothetical protein BZG36_00462 [Bifiguratus adelaidae]
MFTGIVEHMGTVVHIADHDTTVSGGNGWTVTVGDAECILGDCHIGDSIAINGTCLTVTEFNKDTFKVGIAPETLRRTNLGTLKVGSKVNLERAMAAGQRFGGHMVQGHVDSTATITNITPEGNSIWFQLTLPDASLFPYIIPKGFIAIDGTSLTVCDVNDKEHWFTIMMIAHTQAHVVMPLKQLGDKVNIEVDMMGKYALKSVDNMLRGLLESSKGQSSVFENLVKKMLAERTL